MKRIFCVGALSFACGTFLLSTMPLLTTAQSKSPLPISPGQTLFDEHCASCHAGPNQVDRAPDLKTLMEFTPESVLAAMTTGTMALPAQKLTDDEKRFIAEYLGGRPLDSKHSGSADSMSESLPHQPTALDPSAGPSWNGWSAEPRQHAFRLNKERGSDRRRHSPTEAEVGLRISER